MTARALVVALVSAWFLSSPQGQTPPPPTFRAGVDLVPLDVSVLDRDRHPVLGLTARDFTVLEDGRPQDIATFDAVHVPDASAAPDAAPWVGSVPSDVASNDYDSRRLFVLVMDDMLVLHELEMQRTAIAIAHRVIDRMGPADLMAVVFTRDNRPTQDFTSDKAKLSAAVDRFTGGTAFMDGSPIAPKVNGRRAEINTDAFKYDAAVETLRLAADALIAVPQRRKAIVYISEGVPVDVEQAATPALAGGVGKGLENGAIHQRLIDGMINVFHSAQRANVAIYSFDPSPDGFEAALNRFGIRGAPAHEQAVLTDDFLEATASNTGGRAILSAANAPAAVEAMFQENSSYYLLGYRSTNPKTATERRVVVTINRPGTFDVRARSHYFLEAQATVAHPAPPAAQIALSGLLPDPGISMQVSATPFANPDGKTCLVAIALGVTQPAPADRMTQKIDAVARAFTPDGVGRGIHSLDVSLTLRPGEAGAIAEYELLSSLTLKPGRYELRFSLHNETLDKQGSVYTDLVVPDVTRDPLSLSGVALSVSPSHIVAPADAFAAVLPMVPTSRRVFRPTDRVVSFLRLYQGLKTVIAPASVAVRITDQKGTAVFESTEAIAAGRFVHARQADLPFVLPVDRLTAGEYLLTFEATAGRAAARRDVRFSIR